VSPTVFYGGEPLTRWTDQDRLWALGLAEVEADECEQCGQSLQRSTDPSTEDGWVSPPPIRCHACTALADRVEKYGEAKHPRALRFQVHEHGR
jgi:hypothetical protein